MSQILIEKDERSLLVGTVNQLIVYPVKSFAGRRVDRAFVGPHGIEGDRRCGFQRVSQNGRPKWLSARRCPQLLLYKTDAAVDDPHSQRIIVTTPDGQVLDVASEALREDVSRRVGEQVELVELENGCHDTVEVSLMTTGSLRTISSRIGQDVDSRRFRVNIVVNAYRDDPFPEDAWVGGSLLIGSNDRPARLRARERDSVCTMLNLDPDTAAKDPQVLDAILEERRKAVGIYAAVESRGVIAVGNEVRLLKG